MGRGKGKLRVGTSGYQYDHWRGVLYPDDVPKKHWFEVYTQSFDTVEINNTFYNLPKPETFDHWREAAPKGFLYALKMSRFATHIKRLKDPEEPIGRFLEHAERLGDRLGPILVQLPPRWKPQPERLDAFLEAAPREHRWAVEIRDERWLTDEVYDVLAQHGAALVVHDMIEGHPRELTAGWTYLRFHGSGDGKYEGSYSSQRLSAEAKRIRCMLDEGTDVYAFFNNDEGGHAVGDALDLRRLAERR